MLGTILKAGQILELFTEEHPERGITEVAEALDIPKSSAHDLMSSLAEIQLLVRTTQNRYRLGWRLLQLHRVLLEGTEFRCEAVKVMRELVERMGETVHLAVLQGDQVVYVEKFEGTRAVCISASRVGGRLSPHCSAVGKVLWAYSSWAKVEPVVRSLKLIAYTRNTITTMDRLRTELEAVRRCGYAFDLEEVTQDLCCVASPVYDHTGTVIAAMSLSVPSYRFQRRRQDYARAIVSATRQVSGNLGHFNSRRVLHGGA